MPKIYDTFPRLQIALVIGSGLIMLMYLVLFFGEFLGPGELLGTSPLNLFIASIHIVYFLSLRSWLNKRSLISATAIDLILFSLNIVVLLLVTGGFRSIYFTFWLFIILISASLGRWVVYAYLGITLLYLTVAAFFSPDATDFLTHNIVHATSSIAAGFLGMWLWRHHPTSGSGQEAGEYSELSDKLQIEQTKSEALLRSIGDGVMVIDAEGTIQLFNGPACVMTGWPQDEALGINYRNVITLENEEGEEVADQDDPFQQAMASRSTIRRNDLTILNRDKRRINLSLVVSPLDISEGKISGAICVIRDISQEKANARQRDEFISTASHEMRTPVAAIEGFLALAMNEKVSSLDENARKYVTKAYDSTQHLGKLFRDLLSVTKLEDGRIQNNPEPFDLGKVIKDSVEELQFKADKKGLDLKVKAAQEANLTGANDVMPLFYVHADPDRIREVFTNLTDNAIKFTPKGEVNISIEGTDREVTVGIHDQGIGIPKDEVKHLFQKFYRVDSSKTREIGGTGLGLYLSRTIIEMYNGRIWVESEEGKGSNFYFTLPRLTYAQVQEIRSKKEQEAAPQASEPTPAQPEPASSAQEADKTVAPSTTNT